MRAFTTKKLLRFSVSGYAPPLLALAAGTVVYALTREAPPESVFALQRLLGLDALNSAPFALPFAGQLPSFFHMLALMLATNWLTRNHLQQRRAAKTVMLLSALAMEFVQADSVRSTWDLLHGSLPLPDTITRYVYDYVHTGTFDALDVLAIAAAAMVTSQQLVRFIFLRANTTRTS